jgi:hypothetical protein
MMKYFSRRRTGYFGAAVVAMGLLLWARFLLITGHPKTAMATPESPSGTASSAAAADSDARGGTKPEQPARRKPLSGAGAASANPKPDAAH